MTHYVKRIEWPFLLYGSEQLYLLLLEWDGVQGVLQETISPPVCSLWPDSWFGETQSLPQPTLTSSSILNLAFQFLSLHHREQTTQTWAAVVHCGKILATNGEVTWMGVGLGSKNTGWMGLCNKSVSLNFKVAQQTEKQKKVVVVGVKMPQIWELKLTASE